MKVTAATPATILAFILAQAGALPSPEANGGAVTGSQFPPSDVPVYYIENADVEKRDSQGQNHGQHGGRHGGKGHGEHKWKAMGQGKGQGQHGPMPDDDGSVDLTPLFDHPDPEVQEIVRRAIKAPKFHWWEQQGNGGKFMNIVVGNPDVRPLANVKEQDLNPKEFKKRDPEAATNADVNDDSEHAKDKWMDNKHDDGQGKEGNRGNAQWKQWRQSRGHGPMSDGDEE
ncbi:uncharacterized protein Z519_01981 [Cladophialophora bantiana CBS 173.52]|uniref:Uncharacterized protein n=1 Tax=Cladophialophora bantiana (strain ATCC 10958 / CBS 173.52 / CDC B-1940 / NIH 8579) TaxID=1442370 RepID=A0A0D2I0B1_CLAB1|nr:uncharacterized protein Z519_01981 [Cladophialophora bantiana CBS 173.52]KIW96590.1 hypothetical protein Z519_01981 [Cladophialophora bantiana CBS 173.52]